jgi:hypothetical protein
MKHERRSPSATRRDWLLKANDVLGLLVKAATLAVLLHQLL